MFPKSPVHSINIVRAHTTVIGRGIVLLAAASLFSVALPNMAFAGVESDPNLSKLEVKFFEHDYSKEDVGSRLDRLEKLVFGEVKPGDAGTRLKKLVDAVPNLNEPPATASSGGGSNDSAVASDNTTSPATSPAGRASGGDREVVAKESQIENASRYPQVSAMEQRIFGKDYAGEPLVKRLERLETKEFGKISQSDDLSERVDRLKARTGVDLAATPPPGSDWSEDDEPWPNGGGDLTYVPANTTPFAGGRGDTTHSDLPGDRGISTGGAGSSGGYGMRGGTPPLAENNSHGGSYGYNPPSRQIASAGGVPRTAPTGIPQPAPDVVHEPPVAPAPAMGLAQRIALLENTLFNKTFPNDTIPARISNLERTVFPGRRTPPDMSLPERVARLAEVIGPDPSQSGRRQVAQRPADPYDPEQDPAMPRPAPARSGLSKIISGLGNLIGGGGYGAYPVGSNLVTDPQTGMLIDMYSGNIIDPRTGVVVGNRATGGTVPYGGVPYSGFNNGLSPLGGYGTTMRFGMGGTRGLGMGSGMGFGTGFGGMGLGGMGMGVWP